MTAKFLACVSCMLFGAGLVEWARNPRIDDSLGIAGLVIIVGVLIYVWKGR